MAADLAVARHECGLRSASSSGFREDIHIKIELIAKTTAPIRSARRNSGKCWSGTSRRSGDPMVPPPRSELSADGAGVEIDRHDFAFTREIANNAFDIVRIGHPTSMNIDCRMCRVPSLVDPHTVGERSGRLASDAGIAVAVLAP